MIISGLGHDSPKTVGYVLYDRGPIVDLEDPVVIVGEVVTDSPSFENSTSASFLAERQPAFDFPGLILRSNPQ
jgi:hypothetical protein